MESKAAVNMLSALGHDYEGQPYKTSATEHWQICKHNGCTQESTHQAHSGHEATCVAESKCQVCGYKLADKNPNNHANPTLHDAVAPTCTQPGNDAYWHCADCGKYFADKNGDMDTSKAYDTNDRFLKSALGHDFTEKLVDDAHLKSAATCTELSATICAVVSVRTKPVLSAARSRLSIAATWLVVSAAICVVFSAASCALDIAAMSTVCSTAT